MLKLLLSVDQFGVPFQPIVQNDSKLFKSLVGGIFTIVIYSLTLAYFVYVVYRWQNGLTLPTISSQSVIQDGYHEFEFEYSPITVQLIGLQGVETLKNKRVYSPKVTQYVGTKQSGLYTLDKEVDCGGSAEEGIIQTVCLDVRQKSTIQFGSQEGDTTLFFYLYRCDPLQEADCASDHEIE